METKYIATMIVESNYFNQMKKKKEYQKLDDPILFALLFPLGWSQLNDYDIKLKWLKKAIDLNIPLTELDGIYKIGEHVELEAEDEERKL